jgi:glycosyltransferase involved in cell wall biosynthesis
MSDAGVDYRLLIVGDGPLMAELQSMATELELNKSVIFAGERQDIPTVLKAMDIYVLSSISEGISLTLIEAMSCELPVVATAVGGNPEVVVDKETGMLVPSENPAKLAEKILELIFNPAMRVTLGKNGRLRACEKFNIGRAANQYEELYESVVGFH